MAAHLGRYSQMRTPGNLVGIDANGPRISLGISGLTSQVSMWLGPPAIQSRITLLLRGLGLPCLTASARICSNPGKLNPARPARLAFNMLRRLKTVRPSRDRP